MIYNCDIRGIRSTLVLLNDFLKNTNHMAATIYLKWFRYSGYRNLEKRSAILLFLFQPSSAGSQNDEDLQLECPKCGQMCPDMDSLQIHVLECIDQDNSTVWRKTVWSRLHTTVPHGKQFVINILEGNQNVIKFRSFNIYLVHGTGKSHQNTGLKIINFDFCQFNSNL